MQIALNTNPGTRGRMGYAAGLRDAKAILASLSPGELIKIISHSMGAAYAKGFIKGLLDAGVPKERIAFEADFAPFQPRRQSAVEGIRTLQFSHSSDRIAGKGIMKGDVEQMDTSMDENQGHEILEFMNSIVNLPLGEYIIDDIPITVL